MGISNYLKPQKYVEELPFGPFVRLFYLLLGFRYL